MAKQMDQLAQGQEGDYRKATERALEEDKRAVMARARAAARESRAMKQTMDWRLIERDWDAYFEREAPENWREEFFPIIVGTTVDVNDAWTAELGIQFNVQNLLELAVLQYQAYAMQFSEPILETTEADLFALLHTAASEGWTIEQLDAGIEALWAQYLDPARPLTDEERQWFVNRSPRYRVEMIARTESMHAANFGSAELFRAYGAERHEWNATNDQRTRPTHAAASGQVRGIGQPFEVGASLLLYPCDGSLGAAAGEIVNCRCVTVPVIEEVEIEGVEARLVGPLEAGMAAEVAEAERALSEAIAEDVVREIQDVLLQWVRSARDALEREREINEALWERFNLNPEQATEADWRALAEELKREGYELYRKYTKDGIREYVSHARGAQESGYMVVGHEQILVRQGAFSVRAAQRMEGELWADAREDLSDAMGEWLRGIGFSQQDIANADFDQRRRLLAELGEMELTRTPSGRVSRIDDIPEERWVQVLGRIDPDLAATAGFVAIDPLNLPSLDAYGRMEMADVIMQTKIEGED